MSLAKSGFGSIANFLYSLSCPGGRGGGNVLGIRIGGEAFLSVISEALPELDPKRTNLESSLS